MRKYKIAFVFITLLLVGACANNEDEKEQEQEKVESIEEVGFSVTDGSIEEAANVPDEEKEALTTTFEQYITTFNEQDVDGYMALISSEYDIEEEKAFLEDHFEKYEQIREASNVTIVKYSEEEAQVFATISNTLKQLSTGLETEDNIRQVTVFTKEDNVWKIKSVHSIGDN